jgi:hypothetical protein
MVAPEVRTDAFRAPPGWAVTGLSEAPKSLGRLNAGVTLGTGVCVAVGTGVPVVVALGVTVTAGIVAVAVGLLGVGLGVRVG